MTINELLNKLNTYCEDNGVCSVDYIDGEMFKELKDLDFKYVTSVDTDKHRWYVLSEDVYEVTIDGGTYYIGTWDVSTIKSEYMTASDCENLLNFFEMEEYITVSYREKE